MVIEYCVAVIALFELHGVAIFRGTFIPLIKILLFESRNVSVVFFACHAKVAEPQGEVRRDFAGTGAEIILNGIDFVEMREEFGAMPALEDGLTVGCVIKQLQNNFWQSLKKGYEDAGAYIADGEGITLTVDAQAAQDESDEEGQLTIMNNMINTTRELCGAGDAVTGQVNPELASGAAILAVREAATLNLNFAVSQLCRFIEDVALIWYDLLRAYHPAGLTVEGQLIPGKLLAVLEPRVRIDLSPSNPYSKFAQEQTLQNLLNAGYITFQEYVEALDDDANAPKEKLKLIVQNRFLAEPNA